jgi:AcrR family transcriptional regulator
MRERGERRPGAETAGGAGGEGARAGADRARAGGDRARAGGEGARAGGDRARAEGGDGGRRRRDAARSREAILDAAERLFAERGLDRVTLADIGAAAGLSRGAPGYFFGAKDELYAAVLARVFAARTAALAPAFAPLRDWDGDAPLEDAVRAAIDGYVDFLRARPTFVALSQRESLDGGERLAATPHESPVMHDALRALRTRAHGHGLRAFDVEQVVIAFVSLCFFPLSARGTLLRTLGRDADDPAFDRAHREHVAAALLRLLVR